MLSVIELIDVWSSAHLWMISKWNLQDACSVVRTVTSNVPSSETVKKSELTFKLRTIWMSSCKSEIIYLLDMKITVKIVSMLLTILIESANLKHQSYTTINRLWVEDKRLSRENNRNRGVEDAWTKIVIWFFQIAMMNIEEIVMIILLTR